MASDDDDPTVPFTCPRCFFTGRAAPDLRFCPRCGLPEVLAAAGDTSPLEITVGRRSYHVLGRLDIGSIATVYRCRFEHEGRYVDGVCKVVRDGRNNALIANEADIVNRLHAADVQQRFGPFLPALQESFTYDDTGPLPRQANILRTHPDIRSPDELYTLQEVRAHFPAGLDPRDMAWIWRRLLSVLGFAHSVDIIHGAVLPMHVLIEPRDHKLLLIDWCTAQHEPRKLRRAVTIIAGGYIPWYRREKAPQHPPLPAFDVAFAARCMIDLIGGNPLEATFPPAIDPRLQDYFLRCLAPPAGPHTNALSAWSQIDAWQKLEEFDRLIELLWGPRQFRTLVLPPKGPPRS